ncbi:MAG: DUF485 domain-containing protein [Rhodocyclaceae bacterium]|nr:MAG: DUF485 domain-containing protein [Rhodocyclaceae bacterium]
MQEDLVQKVKSNPTYQELKAKRTAYGWTLTIIMLVAYYGYIGVIAFDKALFAAKLGEGVTTWGIPVGVGLIVFTVIITGLYVRRANTEFDEMTAKLLKEIK